MGFCSPDGFDAFLSYARVDDEANNGWVAAFHWYVRRFVAAELRLDEAIRNEDADRLSICFDKGSFPQSGPLDEAIEDYVLKSEFLFIFLGRGYLKSQYCLAELEVFRKKVGGSVEEALRRTYLIVIDREAVKRLQGPPPELLPSDRVALWKRLQDFSNRGIRKEDLLDDDVPLPVMVRDGADRRAAEPFHSRCLPLIREFKGKLVERREDWRPPSPSPPPPGTPTIVLGLVPRRLEGARAELKRELGEKRVAVLEATHFRGGLETIKSRLAGAQHLVVPYDRGEVLTGLDYPPGGHLAVQHRLFEECRQAGTLGADPRLLWWEPVDGPPATGAPGLAKATATAVALTPDEPLKPIDDFDAPFLETIRPEDRRACSARELAAQITPRQDQPSPPRLARVWLAKNEVDAEVVRQAQDHIREIWQDECHRRRPGCDAQAPEGCQIRLKFYGADWKEAIKNADWARNYHGIVLVDGSNPYDALDHQVKFVDDLDAILYQKVIPGLFVIPPQDSPRLEPEEWQILRFRRAEDAVEAEVDQVREFVRRIVALVDRQAPTSPKG
jgi:hypothetical protein